MKTFSHQRRARTGAWRKRRWGEEEGEEEGEKQRRREGEGGVGGGEEEVGEGLGVVGEEEGE